MLISHLIRGAPPLNASARQRVKGSRAQRLLHRAGLRRRLQAVGQAVRSQRWSISTIQPGAVPARDRRAIPASTGSRHRPGSSRPIVIMSNTATGLISSGGMTTICAGRRSATRTWPRPNAASGQAIATSASARTRVHAGRTLPPERSRSSHLRPGARSDKARMCGLVHHGEDITTSPLAHYIFLRGPQCSSAKANFLTSTGLRRFPMRPYNSAAFR